MEIFFLLWITRHSRGELSVMQGVLSTAEYCPVFAEFNEIIYFTEANYHLLLLSLRPHTFPRPIARKLGMIE